MSMPQRPQARLIAECASNHGGDLAVIRRLITAALEAGANFVKFQLYPGQQLASTDPQAAWLQQAQLREDHLRKILTWAGKQAMFSVFDHQGLETLRQLGARAFKVGHADRWRRLWEGAPEDEEWFVSHAWGRDSSGDSGDPWITAMATIPLYPAPLGALAGMVRLAGYSDHTVGLDACKIMLARGVRVVEKHFSIDGCPRRQAWDMDAQGLAELVTWSRTCTEARVGSALTERWG